MEEAVYLAWSIIRVKEEEEDGIGDLKPKQDVDCKVPGVVNGVKADEDGLVEQVDNRIAKTHVAEAQTEVRRVFCEIVRDGCVPVEDIEDRAEQDQKG